MDDLADDLAALFDELALATATVVGLSMGGYAALALAARHPDRLAAPVLADTRAAADGPDARRGRADAIALILEAGVATYLDRSLPRLLAPDASAAVLAQARALAETRPQPLLAGIAALRDRPDRSAELVVPPDEMRAMSAAIPGSRFVIIEGAGHLTSLEAPAPFTAALRDFLAGAAGAAATRAPGATR